ncbi:MAG: ABC transporter permease [Bacillota bacterium]
MKLKHILIVLKKELIDIFRDKKTIFASIIVPIILLPLLFSVMGYGTKQLEENSKKVIPISINGGSSSLAEYLKNSPLFEIVAVEDYTQAVKDNKIKAVIHIPENFDDSIKTANPASITVEYDDTSQQSLNAFSTIKSAIAGYSDKVVIDRLNALNLNESILKVVDIQEKSATPDKGGFGFLMFSMMLPMMLTMWSAVSGMPAAIDLGAGEKERGTLEPLLTTKPKRMSLLMGKYLAVTIAALMGTAASFIGFLISMKMNPNMLGTSKGLEPSSIFIIMLTCIGLSMIFSALQLAVSVYARSFKEASTYLSPLAIIILMPSYLTMLIDSKAIPSIYFHIPLLNAVCIIKEVIVGVFNMQHIVIVLVWSLFYIAFSMIFALSMFKKESVVFRV